MSYVKQAINEHLTRLKRPTIDFEKKKGPHVLKGKARPIHLPAPEERAGMTEEELSLWKAEERRKRKALQARERRARTDQHEKYLRALLADLTKEVNDLEGRGRGADSSKPVGTSGTFVSDGDESHADISDEDEGSSSSSSSVEIGLNTGGSFLTENLTSTDAVSMGSAAAVPFTSEAAAASALLSLSTQFS
jgi:hypothetical protein